MNGHFHLFAVTFSVNFIYETYWLLFLAYTFLCLWPYCFSYLNFFPPPQLPKYFLPGNMKCYLPNSSSASKNIFCSLQLLWLIITTRYYITIIICMCARVHTHTLTHTHTHTSHRILFVARNRKIHLYMFRNYSQDPPQQMFSEWLYGQMNLIGSEKVAVKLLELKIKNLSSEDKKK